MTLAPQLFVTGVGVLLDVASVIEFSRAPPSAILSLEIKFGGHTGDGLNEIVIIW